MLKGKHPCPLPAVAEFAAVHLNKKKRRREVPTLLPLADAEPADLAGGASLLFLP